VHPPCGPSPSPHFDSCLGWPSLHYPFTLTHNPNTHTFTPNNKNNNNNNNNDDDNDSTLLRQLFFFSFLQVKRRRKHVNGQRLLSFLQHMEDKAVLNKWVLVLGRVKRCVARVQKQWRSKQRCRLAHTAVLLKQVSDHYYYSSSSSSSSHQQQPPLATNATSSAAAGAGDNDTLMPKTATPSSSLLLSLLAAATKAKAKTKPSRRPLPTGGDNDDGNDNGDDDHIDDGKDEENFFGPHRFSTVLSKVVAWQRASVHNHAVAVQVWETFELVPLLRQTIREKPGLVLLDLGLSSSWPSRNYHQKVSRLRFHQKEGKNDKQK
jgi:hypothetical protein